MEPAEAEGLVQPERTGRVLGVDPEGGLIEPAIAERVE
jgi:hypothetical protein